MPKTILIIALLLLFTEYSESQMFQKHKIGTVANFGFNTGWQYSRYTQEKEWDLWMLIEPYLGFTKWNANFSLIGEYSFSRASYEEFSKYDIFGLGAFVRYYYPFRINTCKKNTRYFIFLSEFSARKTNYTYLNKSWEFIKANNLKYNHIVFVPVGMQFNIWKGLFAELSTEWNFYSKGLNTFIYRAGFEYKFNFKKNEKSNNFTAFL